MTQTESGPNWGEVTIPAPLDGIYLLGDPMALFNSLGILLMPGFSTDFRLDHRRGHWVLCDAEHSELHGFVPEKAAGQFVDYTGEPLQALLAGYARKAYQLLEPQHPGFTQGLLAQLVAEPVPVVPQPRPQILDLAPVLQAYGCSVQAEGSRVRLLFAAPAVPVARPTDWQLVFTSLTLFIAQLELTPWLLHVAACDPAHNLAQLLGAIARHDLREPEWGGVIGRLFNRTARRREQWWDQLECQPLPLLPFLMLLVGVYEHPENPEVIYDKLPVFKLLRRALEQLPHYDSSARYEFSLACLIDGLEYLARETDTPTSAPASIRLAQEAQIALQLLLERAGPPLTERWFSRMEAHEQGYQWRKLKPDDVLDSWTVWYFANYAGSAALAVKQHSQQLGLLFKQGKITNHLWTAVWRVLNQLRKALRLCYALSQQQPLIATAEDAQKWTLPLQHLLAHYQQILKELAAMIERTSHSSQELSHWATLLLSPEGHEEAEGPLMQELLGCMQVYEALESQGYGSVAIEQLGQLIATMPEAT